MESQVSLVSTHLPFEEGPVLDFWVDIDDRIWIRILGLAHRGFPLEATNECERPAKTQLLGEIMTLKNAGLCVLGRWDPQIK